MIAYVDLGFHVSLLTQVKAIVLYTDNHAQFHIRMTAARKTPPNLYRIDVRGLSPPKAYIVLELLEGYGKKKVGAYCFEYVGVPKCIPMSDDDGAALKEMILSMMVP